MKMAKDFGAASLSQLETLWLSCLWWPRQGWHWGVQLLAGEPQQGTCVGERLLLLCLLSSAVGAWAEGGGGRAGPRARGSPRWGCARPRAP